MTQLPEDADMIQEDDAPPAKAAVSPMAMPLREAAILLSKAGGRPISIEMLQADVANGAPANRDGTLNLVHYGAWLLREMFRPKGD